MRQSRIKPTLLRRSLCVHFSGSDIYVRLDLIVVIPEK